MHITIIGSGPSIIPILAEIRQRQLPFNVTIISSDSLGFGCHKVTLEEYFQLNTISSEVNLSPFSYREIGAPTLYEWAERKNKKWPQNMNSGGRESMRLSIFDHFPRAWLGEYSHDIATQLVNEINEFGSVTLIKGIAEDIYSDRVIYRTNGNIASLTTNAVILATGHGISIDNPANRVPDNCKLSIKGMGLSAVDMLYAVTIGKGGHFTGNGLDMEYIRSGREPVITMSSLSNKPFRYRPLTSKNEPDHICYFIHSKNTQHIDDNSSWKKDIMPLVYLEISINNLYHHYWLTKDYRNMSVIMEYLSSDNYEALERLALENNFYNEIEGIIEPSYPSKNNHYHQDIISFIYSDINEAKKGLYGSSLKFGIEVFRSLRENIRDLFNKIKKNQTEASYFYKTINPMINRNVICHQIERGYESIALSKAGVLKFATGVNDADYEINGFVDNDKQLLFDNLKKRGVEFINYINNKVKVDSNNKLYNPLFLGYAIGPVTEGNTYYNHYVSGGKAASHIEWQAKNIINSLIEKDAS